MPVIQNMTDSSGSRPETYDDSETETPVEHKYCGTGVGVRQLVKENSESQATDSDTTGHVNGVRVELYNCHEERADSGKSTYEEEALDTLLDDEEAMHDLTMNRRRDDFELSTSQEEDLVTLLDNEADAEG